LKRSLRIAAILFLGALLLLCPLGCNTTPPLSSAFPAAQHGYAMELALDPDGKTVNGTVTVDYANPTSEKLDTAYFSLYPNAYQRESTAPFFPEDMDAAYPQGFSPGGIQILNVLVDGQKADYTLGNEDETLLAVALGKELAPQERTSVSMEVQINLPHSLGRFGYGDRTINLCNFYPIACVYRDGEFLSYPYYKAGDPFVSHTAAYDVTFTAPSRYVLAHTGAISRKEERDGFTTYWISAKDVRDFAMVLSPDFQTETTTENGVAVTSYYFPETADQGKRASGYAAGALSFLNSRGMPYPYETLAVVQTDFFIGGMEYPGIVLIDQSLYQGGLSASLEEVVAHESIHQLFYGVVGNDQVQEPWLDEATTSYLTLKYFGYAYGPSQEQAMYHFCVDDTAQFIESAYRIDAKLNRVGTPMDAFPNSALYSLAVYTTGTKMYYDLERALGEDALLAALANYCEEYKFGIASGENLIQSLEASTQKNLNSIFEKWL